MASSSRRLIYSSSSSSEDEEMIIDRETNQNIGVLQMMLPSLMATPAMMPHQQREYVFRDREGSHRQLWQDYFAENCTYPPEMFRRRYRMQKVLFLRILHDVQLHSRYFVQRPDATGRMGLSSLQKMTAAIRLLAYGSSADILDEWLKIAESNALESLLHFCDAVIDLYEDQYMRAPNVPDITQLLQAEEERGFPGMLGSLDCMHWTWKNCPAAWHGSHRGHHKKPTLILEAVASKDTWIWHAFFGMAGAHNDVTVLDHSPLFDRVIKGQMPNVEFIVNGHPHTMGYYLTDGIYPPWATLIQSIPQPTPGNEHLITEKESLFKRRHEAVKKDVERAFGILQGRWAITQGPARLWKNEDFSRVMKTCIILHNMIVEDEREMFLDQSWNSPADETCIEQISDPGVLVAHIASRLRRIRNRAQNQDLKNDLIDHIWNQYGDQVQDN